MKDFLTAGCALEWLTWMWRDCQRAVFLPELHMDTLLFSVGELSRVLGHVTSTGSCAYVVHCQCQTNCPTGCSSPLWLKKVGSLKPHCWAHTVASRYWMLSPSLWKDLSHWLEIFIGGLVVCNIFDWALCWWSFSFRKLERLSDPVVPSGHEHERGLKFSDYIMTVPAPRRLNTISTDHTWNLSFLFVDHLSAVALEKDTFRCHYIQHAIAALMRQQLTTKPYYFLQVVWSWVFFLGELCDLELWENVRMQACHVWSVARCMGALATCRHVFG